MQNSKENFSFDCDYGDFVKLREELAGVPVVAVAQDVAYSVINKENFTILTADTGSGKTLFANTLLSDRSEDQWVVLVPRRTLAINAAETIAKLAGLQVGEEVGYAVGQRGEEGSSYSRNTKLLFATNGYALRSGLVKKAKNFTIDEVHEGGAEIALIRAILHDRISAENGLNIVEMSATINAEKQAAFWQDVVDVDIYHAEGSVFPCEQLHVPPGEKSVQQIAIDLVTEHNRKGVAVFQPGKKEVEDTAQRIRWKAENMGLDIEVCTIYGDKDPSQRSAALKPAEKDKPKILVGTDVIETGMNIPWLDSGISDGTCKIPINSNMSTKGLETVDLAQWRLKQQQGRVNRFQPGIFVINADKDFDARPEMLSGRFNGAELALMAWQAVTLGYDPESLKYDSEISDQDFQKVKAELQGYGLIKYNWQLTKAGKFACHLPVTPPIASMLWEAKELGILKNGIELAAVMEAGGLREDRDQAHFPVLENGALYTPVSDTLDSLRAYQEYRQGLIHNPKQFNIDLFRLRIVEETIQTISERCKTDDLQNSKTAAATELRQLILSANRTNLYLQLGDDESQIAENTKIPPKKRRFVTGYLSVITGERINIRNSPSMLGVSPRFITGEVWRASAGRGVMNSITHLTTEDILTFLSRHPEVSDRKSFVTAGNGKDYISLSYFGGHPINLAIPSEMPIELQRLLGKEYVAFLEKKESDHYNEIATALGVETKRLIKAFETDSAFQTVIDRTINSDLYDAGLPFYLTDNTDVNDGEALIRRFDMGGENIHFIAEETVTLDYLETLTQYFPQLLSKEDLNQLKAGAKLPDKKLTNAKPVKLKSMKPRIAEAEITLNSENFKTVTDKSTLIPETLESTSIKALARQLKHILEKISNTGNPIEVADENGKSRLAFIPLASAEALIKNNGFKRQNFTPSQIRTKLQLVRQRMNDASVFIVSSQGEDLGAFVLPVVLRRFQTQNVEVTSDAQQNNKSNGDLPVQSIGVEKTDMPAEMQAPEIPSMSPAVNEEPDSGITKETVLEEPLESKKNVFEANYDFIVSGNGYSACKLSDVAKNYRSVVSWMAEHNNPLIIQGVSGIVGVFVAKETALPLCVDGKLKTEHVKQSKLSGSFKSIRTAAEESAAIFIQNKGKNLFAYLSANQLGHVLDIELDVNQGIPELAGTFQKRGRKAGQVIKEQSESGSIAIHEEGRIETGSMGFIGKQGVQWLDNVSKSKEPIAIANRAGEFQAILIPLEIAEILQRDENLKTSRVTSTDFRVRFKKFRENLNCQVVYFITSHNKNIGACVSPELLTKVQEIEIDKDNIVSEFEQDDLDQDSSQEVSRPKMAQENYDFIVDGEKYSACKLGQVAPNASRISSWIQGSKKPLIVQGVSGIVGGFVPYGVADSFCQNSKSNSEKIIQSKLSNGFKAVRKIADEGTIVFIESRGENQFAYVAPKQLAQIIDVNFDITKGVPELAGAFKKCGRKATAGSLNANSTVRAKNQKTIVSSDMNYEDTSNLPKSMPASDSLTAYFREMGGHELLSREEEYALAEQLENGKKLLFEGLLHIPGTIMTLSQWKEEIVSGGLNVRKLVQLNGNRQEEDAEDFDEEVELEEEEEKITSEGDTDLSAQIIDIISNIEKACDDGDHEKAINNAYILHLRRNSLDQLVQPIQEASKVLISLDGQMLALAKKHKIPRDRFLEEYKTFYTSIDWETRVTSISEQWATLIDQEARAIANIKDRAQKALSQLGCTVEQLRAASLIVNRGDQEITSARDKMIQSNLRLVPWVAKKYRSRGLKFSDLVQEGNLGLIRAVDKFDRHRGYKFATYAILWIKQAITRSIANKSQGVRVPVHIQELQRKILSATNDLREKHGRKPSVEELADYLEITPHSVQNAIEAYKPSVSFDAPVGQDGDNERTLGEVIGADKDEIAKLINDLGNKQYIQKLIDNTNLKPRELDILRARYLSDEGDMRTLEDVGEEFGVTRERIRQIEAQALNKIYRTARRLGNGRDMNGNVLPDERPKVCMNSANSGARKPKKTTETDTSVEDIEKKPVARKPKTVQKVVQKPKDGQKFFDDSKTEIIDKDCKLERVGGLVVCPMGLISVFGSKYAAWARDYNEPVAIMDRSDNFQGGFIPPHIVSEIDVEINPETLDMQDFKSGFSKIRARIATQPVFSLKSKGKTLAAYASESVFEAAKSALYIFQEAPEAQASSENAEQNENTDVPTLVLESATQNEEFEPSKPVGYLPSSERTNAEKDKVQDKTKKIAISDTFKTENLGSIGVHGTKWLNRVQESGEPIELVDHSGTSHVSLIPLEMAEALIDTYGLERHQVTAAQFRVKFKSVRETMNDSGVYLVTSRNENIGACILPSLLATFGKNFTFNDEQENHDAENSKQSSYDIASEISEEAKLPHSAKPETVELESALVQTSIDSEPEEDREAFDLETLFMGSIPTEGRKYFKKITQTHMPLAFVDRDNVPQGLMLPLHLAEKLSEHDDLQELDVGTRNFYEGFRSFRKNMRNDYIYYISSRKKRVGAFVHPSLLDRLGSYKISPILRDPNFVSMAEYSDVPLSFRIKEDEFLKLEQGRQENGSEKMSEYVRAVLFADAQVPETVDLVKLKLEPSKKITKHLSLRVTEEEAVQLRIGMEAAGCDHMSVYVRDKLFGTAAAPRHETKASVKPVSNDSPHAESTQYSIEKKLGALAQEFNLQNTKNLSQTLSVLETAIAVASDKKGYTKVVTPTRSFWIVADPEALDYFAMMTPSNTQDIENGVPVHSSEFPDHGVGAFDNTLNMVYAFKMACNNQNAVLERPNNQCVGFIGNAAPLEAYSLAKSILENE